MRSVMETNLNNLLYASLYAKSVKLYNFDSQNLDDSNVFIYENTVFIEFEKISHCLFEGHGKIGVEDGGRMGIFPRFTFCFFLLYFFSTRTLMMTTFYEMSKRSERTQNDRIV